MASKPSSYSSTSLVYKFFFVANSFCSCKIGGETWHQIWVTTVPHALTDDYTQISMCKRTVNAVKYEL